MSELDIVLSLAALEQRVAALLAVVAVLQSHALLVAGPTVAGTVVGSIDPVIVVARYRILLAVFVVRSSRTH